MQIGINVAQFGTSAIPQAVCASAEAAEALGYHSLWVFDRLLAPLEPAAGYLGDEPLPEEQATSLDPLATLTYAAAVTERVRLGTSVLAGPWYPPLLLARSLASLDVLSGGRLTVGLGLGWSPDERRAAGVEPRLLGARQEELLDVLAAAWGPDPVSHRGSRSTISPSVIGLKPLQRPRPPILLASRSQAGFDRIARRADGWNPTGVPVEALAPTFAAIRDLAAGHGRDPDALTLIVRADVHLTDRPIDGDRPGYHGHLEQIADDLAATARAGAHEVILGLVGGGGLDGALDAYAGLAEALELRTTGPAVGRPS